MSGYFKTMAICVQCGQAGAVQQGLPTIDNEGPLCLGCVTIKESENMLETLPTPSDDNWDDLSDWEQGFVSSLRRVIERKKIPSGRQFETLESIYKKNR